MVRDARTVRRRTSPTPSPKALLIPSEAEKPSLETARVFVVPDELPGLPSSGDAFAEQVRPIEDRDQVEFAQHEVTLGSEDHIIIP